jgi:hypothetical protein
LKLFASAFGMTNLLAHPISIHVDNTRPGRAVPLFWAFRFHDTPWEAFQHQGFPYFIPLYS